LYVAVTTGFFDVLLATGFAVEAAKISSLSPVCESADTEEGDCDVSSAKISSDSRPGICFDRVPCFKAEEAVGLDPKDPAVVGLRGFDRKAPG